MGRVVTFTELSKAPARDGVLVAPITGGETPEMAAEYVRIEAGSRWAAAAVPEADRYLFAVGGEGEISAGDSREPFSEQSFATVQEGVSATVENKGTEPLQIVSVLAPPHGNARGLPGFRGGLEVLRRAQVAPVDIPDQRKKRIYFVGHDHGSRSERGHGMIVVYDGQTNTPLHHHPNADSMFVVLEGAVEFTVNGEQAVVKPGQAAYFPTGDVHALHTADGHPGASFLEFHIPARFTTVKEQAS